MSNNITRYTTISSLSDYEEQLSLSHNKLFYKSLVESDGKNIIVNSTSLANKYYDYIQDSVITVELTNKEYMKYRYQPKLFSYDMYGTVELWSLILKINNFTSVSEFNTKRLKVFNSNIFNILNEVLINEQSALMENYNSVGL